MKRVIVHDGFWGYCDLGRSVISEQENPRLRSSVEGFIIETMVNDVVIVQTNNGRVLTAHLTNVDELDE